MSSSQHDLDQVASHAMRNLVRIAVGAVVFCGLAYLGYLGYLVYDAGSLAALLH